MSNQISVDHVLVKFNALDIKIRYALFVLVLILILLIDFFAFMQFQLKGLKTSSEEIKKATEDIERFQTDQQRIGQIKGTLKNSKEQFEELNANVRALQDVPLIMQEMNALATDANLTVDQISPLRDKQEDFFSSGDIKLYSLPIVLSFHSGYHNFGKFLNALENSKLMFLVQDLVLAGNDKQNVDIGVTMTVRLVLSDIAAEAGK